MAVVLGIAGRRYIHGGAIGVFTAAVPSGAAIATFAVVTSALRVALAGSAIGLIELATPLLITVGIGVAIDVCYAAGGAGRFILSKAAVAANRRIRATVVGDRGG